MAEAHTPTESDEQLFARLSNTLKARITATPSDIPAFLGQIRSLPRGLRAMAATYELDVSMTLDDLAWHFTNWYDRDLAAETSLGLRELEAFEPAALFDEAYRLVAARSEEFGAHAIKGAAEFTEWCENSGLQATINPLNDRLWSLLPNTPGPGGLFRYWIAYARKYPDRVLDSTLPSA